MQPPKNPIIPDPLHKTLDNLECAAERWVDPAALGFPLTDELMDPMGQMLTRLEDSIDFGADLQPKLPAVEPEPLPIAQLPAAVKAPAPRNPDPPAPVESQERDWPTLMAPPAARPYFAHEGLDDRGYHLQLGGSTGIRADSAPLTRWCDERKELVTQETCSSCTIEECCYESEQESEKKEAEEPEREE